MVTLHPEFTVDEKQHRRMVLLPVMEWDRVIEELEELDDIRAFDAARKSPQESVPFEQAVREIGEGYQA